MLNLLLAVLGSARSLFRTQRELALENLALRQQVAVLFRSHRERRLRLGVWDRAFWVILSQRWEGWRDALAIVEPATVVRWHREAFKRFWRHRSWTRRPGRPGLDREVVNLIRRMAQANFTWGAPRIRNELAMLGIEVAISTLAKYMPRRRKPPSSTWRSFLENHLRDLVAIDFFVVPTATFRILFGFIVVAHDRRRVVHFNVTAHPTAEWTARQVVQAFPEETAPRFLLRDRDKVYGERFQQSIEGLGVEEIVTAARSPWQNQYAERLIGSLRRDCLDHVIVLDEVHLRRVLARYFEYYNETRCHLSLQGDTRAPRAVQGPESDGSAPKLPLARGEFAVLVGRHREDHSPVRDKAYDALAPRRSPRRRSGETSPGPSARYNGLTRYDNRRTQFGRPLPPMPARVGSRPGAPERIRALDQFVTIRVRWSVSDRAVPWGPGTYSAAIPSTLAPPGTDTDGSGISEPFGLIS